MDMSIRCCLETPEPGGEFADGSPGAGARGIVLRDFLAANYDRLYRRLVNYLGCPDQASDCLHDAWLRLGDMTVAVAVQNPEAYVYRVACNLAMDRMRTNRSWQYVADADTELEYTIDHSPGPAAIAEARSDLAAVQRAMQNMPRRNLAVLMASRIDELTRDEIAACYGLSAKSVDFALRQALTYCAEQTKQPLKAGGSRLRRSPPRWRANTAAVAAAGNAG